MNRDAYPMNGPAYAVARTAAPAVQLHLARHFENARGRGRIDLASEAGADVIESIIEAGFWASLRHEEGRAPKISLAYLPPDQSADPLLFNRRRPLSPETLTRLAPAVERPGIHLGVWGEANDLCIWGATRTLPELCFVLEVVEAGLLVVKYSRSEGFGKFGNVAVLRGDSIDVVDEAIARRPDCPDLLASLLGVYRSDPWMDGGNALVQLALSMRAHGHGGSLLVVPGDSLAWQSSVVLPMPYLIEPAFTRLNHLIGLDLAERDGTEWRQSLRDAIEGVAGLTAVDGAAILNDEYELLAFGAKIKRADGAAEVRQVVVTEPVVGNSAAVVEPGELGGTRHLSAAQFVHDQRDALALVASQDGRFTVFAWSDRHQLVRAHRIDSLLL